MFKQYDPDFIAMSFAGIPILGLAPDTFVECERNEDAFTEEVGAGGDVTRVRNRNKTGVIRFTVMAESPTNDLLALKAAADEVFMGLGLGPAMVKNVNGTTLAMSPIAWIRKVPTVSYAKSSAGTREWVIACADLDLFVGGSII